MATINNVLSGGPYSYLYGRITNPFKAISYNGSSLNGDRSSSEDDNIDKEVRGTIKKITISYDALSGNMSNIALKYISGQQPVNMMTQTATLISGKTYRAEFAGQLFEQLIQHRVNTGPNKNELLQFGHPNDIYNNTFNNVHLSIMYDFAYPIYAEVVQPDPNIADPVKIKVKYDGMSESQESENAFAHINRVYHESTLAFTGHAPIVKSGAGRNIEYTKEEIKAKTGTISVKLFKTAYNAYHNTTIYSPIGSFTQNVTFNGAPPIIYSLEPDNIDINVGLTQKVSWTSARQARFKLTAAGIDYQGTTESSVLIPANTFLKGNNNITLQIWDGIAATTKTVTFRGYGKPTTPVFDNKNIYNTASPKIKWTIDEQHIYQFQIFENDVKIYDTGEVISSAQEHQVTEILQNKTTYTVKVRVKNDKGLWSDLAQKDIEISYVALEPATLTLFETNSQIVINVNNPGNVAFEKCEVYRKTDYTPWRRIAKNAPLRTSFADNLIASNTEYSYKVISYDKQGGATESDIKTAKIKLKTEQFINLDGMEFLPRVYTTKDTGFTVQKVQDKTITKFEGMTAPMIESGEKDYSVLKCSAAFLNFEDYKQFKYIADNAQVIMFRSALGHLIYGQVTSWGDESAISSGLVTINFTFTEINFIESEIYDGGMTLRIIRLDAGYKLDVGYELDGYYNG